MTKPKPRFPQRALSTLTKKQRAEARAWWAALNDEARVEFVELWDRRADDASWYGERQPDGSVSWQPLPVELRGLIIEGRRDGRRSRWSDDLYEYLVSHPEVVIVMEGRTFHVCRAHATAREVLRRGLLEGDFSCPLGRADCPMRTICDSARGRTVRFGVTGASRRAASSRDRSRGARRRA